MAFPLVGNPLTATGVVVDVLPERTFTGTRVIAPDVPVWQLTPRTGLVRIDYPTALQRSFATTRVWGGQLSTGGAAVASPPTSGQIWPRGNRA